MRIVAVGNPKGGVGKTTTSVTVATVAAKHGLNVILIDADKNRSALDWCAAADDVAIPIDVTDGRDPAELRRLREIGGYDLAILDLPGAHETEFEAILTGEDGRPVADLLVCPTQPELMDLRPLIRTLHTEVIPLGLPHMVVLSRVPTEALRRARTRQAELRNVQRLTVADTIIRRLVAYDVAVEQSATVLDIGGPHSNARIASGEYRHLTAEILTAVGLTMSNEEVPTHGTHT